jgi:type VI secretion system secreted protein VgrG
VEITAEDNVYFRANKKKKTLVGFEEMVFKCAGAVVRFKGGNVELIAPGTISIKFGNYSQMGPASMTPDHPSFPEAGLAMPVTFKVARSPRDDASTWNGMPYKLYANGVLVQEGVLDHQGNLAIDHNPAIQKYQLEMVNGAKFDIPVTTQYTNPAQGALASQGFRKHVAGSAPEEGRVESKDAPREQFMNLLHPKKPNE